MTNATDDVIGLATELIGREPDSVFSLPDDSSTARWKAPLPRCADVALTITPEKQILISTTEFVEVSVQIDQRDEFQRTLLAILRGNMVLIRQNDAQRPRVSITTVYMAVGNRVDVYRALQRDTRPEEIRFFSPWPSFSPQAQSTSISE